MAMIKTYCWIRPREEEEKGKDSDPPKDDQASSSKKGKPLAKTSKADKPVDANENITEQIQEVLMDAKEPSFDNVVNDIDQPKADTWFNNMVDALKDPLTFDELMSTPLDFSKFAMNRRKLDKLTKENQLDWANPEGDRCPYDMSNPLPLQEKEGRLTIPVEFFFNNDLEYLKAGNMERKYSSLITKTKESVTGDPNDSYSTGHKSIGYLDMMSSPQ
ncbi:hypothetical protein Tco_0233028 [Tanacetum coccineum]